MYSKFRIKISDVKFTSDLYEIGKATLEAHKEKIESQLEKFIDYESGIIDGSSMEKNLFKEIEANIFLSHSHNDEELAISFAGWLKRNFDLNAFVDSCVWAYADNILRKINDKYNKINKNDSEKIVYDYQKTNYAASHIYSMLTSALINMIDKTECFMFMDTDFSLIYMDKDIAKNNPKTLSPWIYSENIIANTIRTSDIIRPSTEFSHRYTENVKISHDLNFPDFLDLDSVDLKNWFHFKNKDMHPLDRLYLLKKKGKILNE